MFIVKQACKQIILCFLLLTCAQSLYAQTDSSNQTAPNERIGMDTVRLTPDETKELQNAASYPGWYLVKQIACFFNVGVYYSYLSPTGSFKDEVPPTSAFSFDFAVDLTRMFGENESNVHCFIGLNSDFANFGKVKNPYTTTVGDTTYEINVKNSLNVFSYYLEVDYRKSYLTPFVSIAYSDVFFNPHKAVTTKIHSASVNSTYTEGSDMAGNKSSGMNTTAGIKCRLPFNDHKEVMVIARVSYLICKPVEMMDLYSAKFSPTGQLDYQTKTVTPTWLMYSFGIKYNF